MLDEKFLLFSGYYHFRIVVEVAVTKRTEQHMENAYYMTFGVTAQSPSQALQIVEREFENNQLIVNEALTEVTITPIHPDNIPKETANEADILNKGIHFVSGRIFFDPNSE